MNPGEDLLSFSTEDVNGIFDELKTLGVELDPDPLAFGPKRLNQKVAELRSATGRTERIFLELSQRHHLIQRMKTMASAEIEMSKKDLYANDPETRAGRSVSDREAIAYGKLRDEILALQRLELALQSLEAVLTAVKATRSDLRDTQGRLRDQMRLCMEEIALGSAWGSQVPNAPTLRPRAFVAPVNLKAVDSLLGRVEGEINPGMGVDLDEELGTGFTEDAPEIIDVGVIETPTPAQPPVSVKDEDQTEDEEEEDGIEGLADLEDEDFLGSDSQEDALPASAPEKEVLSFLDDLPEDLMGGSEINKPKNDVDEDLDSILESFDIPV